MFKLLEFFEIKFDLKNSDFQTVFVQIFRFKLFAGQSEIFWFFKNKISKHCAQSQYIVTIKRHTSKVNLLGRRFSGTWRITYHVGWNSMIAVVGFWPSLCFSFRAFFLIAVFVISEEEWWVSFFVVRIHPIDFLLWAEILEAVKSYLISDWFG